MLIIFDLDDTLIKTTDFIIPEKIRRTLSPLFVENPSLIEDLIRLDSMSLSSKAAMGEFAEIHGIEENVITTLSKALADENFEGIKVPCHDEVAKVLKELRQGHTLCLVTKGEQKRQENKIKASGIAIEDFDKVVFCAHSKGADYAALLEEFNVDPKEAIVCGDRVSYDLRPAKALGMTTIQFLQGRGKASFDYYSDVDYKIIQLVEVFDIIKEVETRNFLRSL